MEKKELSSRLARARGLPTPSKKCSKVMLRMRRHSYMELVKKKEVS
jgi:hypothetical protein